MRLFNFNKGFDDPKRSVVVTDGENKSITEKVAAAIIPIVTTSSIDIFVLGI